MIPLNINLLHQRVQTYCHQDIQGFEIFKNQDI